MKVSCLVRIRFIVCVIAAAIAAALFTTPARAAERVALVVGNSAYERISPLRNPVNDATLVADTLRRLGFDVLEKTDATQQELKSAIRDFGRRLRTAGSDAVGLFYFAGHGVQSGEHNYLVPLGAPIEEEADLEFEAVPARWVLGRMEAARNALNVVILDACRNNPYKSSFRTGSRGLSRIDAPTGSLIAYSAGPGSVAVDGKGRNSPYTLALVDALEVSGLKVEEVFKRVRNSVLKETAERQTPWEESSLRGDFYFRGGPSAASVPVLDTQPRPSLDERAKVAYEAAERIHTIAAFALVVEQFSGHLYGKMAQVQIDEMREAGAPRAAPATVEARLALSADEIRLIQMGLKSAGQDPGAADGKLGAKTRAALRAWQDSQGLPPTSRLDKESATALRSAGESARETLRIVGGEEAEAGEWPWQVFVMIRNDDGKRYSYCGGSVVAPRWVLTAAHCVVKRSSGVVSPNRVKVRVGTQNRRKGGRWINVTAVRSHEGYRFKENDIALLRLARPAGVESIELPDAARVASIAAHGTRTTATGWGTLWEDGKGAADHLMEVELPVVGERACRAAYPGSPIDHRTLCAGLDEGGKDTCQGDSGGPLVVRDGTRWVQVGVVSWGAGCARPGEYGVYMNVGAFADWLEQNSEFAIAVVGKPVVPEPAVPEPSKPEPPAPVVSTPTSERARKLSRLLGRDFSVNVVDRTTGWTDLHYAGVLNLPQVAKRLLDAGMDANAGTKEFDFATMTTEETYKGVSAILSKFDNVDAHIFSDNYVVGRRSGHHGWAPLHYAARGNSVETARLLIERGANIHALAQTSWNRDMTPLHFAVKHSFDDMVKLLVALGADIHAPAQTPWKKGIPPLHFAVRDSLDMVRLLVALGADRHATDDAGESPLHEAASFRGPETIQWLVDRGADIHVKNNRGETPLHSAATPLARNRDILEYPASAALLLVELGADIHATDNAGRTPLHYAAYTQWANAARILIEHGADVHATNNAGQTPLHNATEIFNNKEAWATEMARLLIERGADVNAADNRGATPLHETAFDVERGSSNVEMARLLIERGANANARTLGGDTPLDILSDTTPGSPYPGEVDKMVQLLRSHGGTCARNC